MKRKFYFFVLVMCLASVQVVSAAVQFSKDSEVLVFDTDCIPSEDLSGVQLSDEALSILEDVIVFDTSRIPNEDLSGMQLSEEALSIFGITASNPLGVPVKTQGNYNICWAACVASVGQYRGGANKTALQVYNAAGVNAPQGASWATTASQLLVQYKVPSTVYTGMTSVPNSIVRNQISNGKPVILLLDVYSANSQGVLSYEASHMVVADGYSGTDSLTIMDSNYSSKYTVRYFDVLTNTPSKIGYIYGSYIYLSHGYMPCEPMDPNIGIVSIVNDDK